MSDDPQTPAEWQEAVNLAEFCVLLDSARQYGLVRGGPKVDVERCLLVLSAGRTRGVLPQRAELDRLTRIFAGGEA